MASKLLIPLKNYNETPVGRPTRDLRKTLQTNQLKGNPPIEDYPISNDHRYKKALDISTDVPSNELGYISEIIVDPTPTIYDENSSDSEIMIFQNKLIEPEIPPKLPLVVPLELLEDLQTNSRDGTLESSDISGNDRLFRFGSFLQNKVAAAGKLSSMIYSGIAGDQNNNGSDSDDDHQPKSPPIDLSKNEILAIKRWTKQNTTTILKWVTIGSCYIKALEKNIKLCRMIIRFNTILSIIMTTTTGSIGVSQISSTLPPFIAQTLIFLFTFLSFSLTIFTGVIKVAQIHENLEKYIQIKQEWSSFITNISTELQLPKEERVDAIKLIHANKNIYLSLLNKDVEFATNIEYDIRSDIIRKKKKSRRHNDGSLHESILANTGISIYDIAYMIVKEESDDIDKTTNAAAYEARQLHNMAPINPNLVDAFIGRLSRTNSFSYQV